MAVRVTTAEVKEIMNTALTDAVILAYITSANIIINSIFSGDTATSAEMLKEIERWFTAHMIASSKERSASKEKNMEVSVEYTGQWGKYLDATPYGQMVRQMDTSGKMSKVGKQVISMTAIKSFDE